MGPTYTYIKPNFLCDGKVFIIYIDIRSVKKLLKLVKEIFQ